MFRYRSVNVAEDKDVLLELHCRVNYESETPFARKMSFDTYRGKWLASSQPERFLSDVAESLKDQRTLAEFLMNEEDSVAGYLWVTFTDVKGYDLTIASIMDIAVAPKYQRQGIGTAMMKRVEETARNKGAILLRSDTGVENIASRRLHEKAGFKLYRVCYEKVLSQRR